MFDFDFDVIVCLCIIKLPFVLFAIDYYQTTNITQSLRNLYCNAHCLSSCCTHLWIMDIEVRAQSNVQAGLLKIELKSIQKELVSYFYQGL